MVRISRVLVGLTLFTGAGVLGVVLAGEARTRSSDFELLADDSSAIRENGIRQLASTGSSNLGHLLNGIEDEPLLVVKAGLGEAVRRIGLDGNHVDSAKSLLRSNDAATRQQAVLILGASQPEVARTELLALAADAKESISIRASAALAVGKAGAAREPLAKMAADAALPASVREAAIRGLALTGSAGAEAVAAIASQPKRRQEDRVAAIVALEDTSVSALALLADLGQSKDPWLRAAVLAAFVERGEKGANGLIAAATKDGVAEVRLAALRALIALGGSAAGREAVIPLLADADVRVTALAANSVGVTCADIPKRVQPALAGLLGSPNFEVRYEAALALLAHGDKGGAATMLADKASPNPSVSIQAGQTYTRITGK